MLPYFLIVNKVFPNKYRVIMSVEAILLRSFSDELPSLEVDNLELGKDKTVLGSGGAVFYNFGSGGASVSPMSVPHSSGQAVF